MTGAPLLWGADRTEIVDDLLAWLDHELGGTAAFTRQRGRGRLRPDLVRTAPRSPLASDDPLVIEVAGKEVRLGGLIDRIDYTPGGRVPGASTTRAAPAAACRRTRQLKGGRALQLPLYLLAGAMLLTSTTPRARPATRSSRAAAGSSSVTFRARDYEARRDEVEQVLARIVGGIATGDFHPEPSDETCRYCDYRNLCDVGRAADPASASATTAQVVSFAEMREIA